MFDFGEVRVDVARPQRLGLVLHLPPLLVGRSYFPCCFSQVVEQISNGGEVSIHCYGALVWPLHVGHLKQLIVRRHLRPREPPARGVDLLLHAPDVRDHAVDTGLLPAALPHYVHDARHVPGGEEEEE